MEWNRCFFRGENYLELWWFSRNRSKDNNKEENGFYLRNTDVLTKFILYFKQYSSSFLDHFNKKDFAIFNKGFDFSTAEFLPEEYYAVSHFLQDLSHKALNINGSFIKFSSREIECLNNLCFGKTSKEIAKTLNISPRTVESHINKIKLKTGYYSKSDLIKLFQDSFLF